MRIVYIASVLAITLAGCTSTSAVPTEIKATPTLMPSPTPSETPPEEISDPFEMKAEDIVRILKKEYGYSFEWVEGEGYKTEVGDITMELRVGEGGSQADRLEEIGMTLRGTSVWLFEQSSPWWAFLRSLGMGKFGTDLIKWLNREYGGTYQVGYIGDYEVEANRLTSGVDELRLAIREQ